MKNKNLNKDERRLLEEIFDTFVDSDRHVPACAIEHNALIDEMRMARYITLTYHDVVMIVGNDMRSCTVPWMNLCRATNDKV